LITAVTSGASMTSLEEEESEEVSLDDELESELEEDNETSEMDESAEEASLEKELALEAHEASINPAKVIKRKVLFLMSLSLWSF
jgi:hypothetical protein